MYFQVLEINGIYELSNEDEIAVRKQIRKDVKAMMKQDYNDNYDYNSSDEEYYQEEDNMERRIEDKVMFGSDSDQDIVDYVMNKKSIEYYGQYVYDSEEDEEGEEEQEEYGPQDDGLSFDQEESKVGKRIFVICFTCA